MMNVRLNAGKWRGGCRAAFGRGRDPSGTSAGAVREILFGTKRTGRAVLANGDQRARVLIIVVIMDNN